MIKTKKQTKKAIHKIALYIRVSTEEQASNPEGSIKSQEQRLRHHVQFRNFEETWGDVVDVYIDRAKSGKDTNRPQLQRLLKAITKGEISLVMVTELSRLSRNIKDFCEIWELMREHKCEFQSLREQFDTTSAAGEMVLMSLANIAQFERKQVSERVRYNFRARAERGLFNGGCIPVGLKKHPEKRGYLAIDDDEAKIVKEIFATFLREQTLASTGKSLQERGYRLPKTGRKAGAPSRSGNFTVDNIQAILTQRAYIGERVIRKPDEENESVQACWPPIIAKEDFDKVQAVLKSNRYHPRTYKNQRFPFLLSSLCYCAKCGDTMSGKSANGNGGKIPYYEHSWATKKQSFLNKKVFACEPHRILASRIEPQVWDKVSELLANPEVAKRIITKAHQQHSENPTLKDQEQISNRIHGISEQIEALAEHLGKIPKGVSPDPIYAQMQKLNDKKEEEETKLAEVRASGAVNEVPFGLMDYVDFCKAVNMIVGKNKETEIKNQILRRLIHKVEITPNTFKIHYFVGEDSLGNNIEKLKEIHKVTELKKEKAEEDFSSSAFFSSFGSKRLIIGWGGK